MSGLISFQYEILNNVFYLNKKLYNVGLSNTHLSSFLKNGRRDNKSPVLLLYLLTRYLESSSSLFHWLLTFLIFH